MSHTFSVYPILRAFYEISSKICFDLEWISDDEKQMKFIHDYLDSYWSSCLIESVKIPEISSSAMMDINKINEVLKKTGSKIVMTDPELENLTTLPTFHGVKVISELNFLVHWFKKGKAIVQERERDGLKFDAVKLSGAGTIIFKDKNGYPFPVARLKTETDDLVYITRATEELTGIELFEKVGKFELVRHVEYENKYKGVIFPMVELIDKPVDLSFLIGINAPLDKENFIVINKAKSENTLKMNEVGARVIARAAINAMIIGCRSDSIPCQPLVIDEPYYVWFKRPDLSKPLFAGYFDEKDWKKPIKL